VRGARGVMDEPCLYRKHSGDGRDCVVRSLVESLTQQRTRARAVPLSGPGPVSRVPPNSKDGVGQMEESLGGWMCRR
jgi:hypothetical protein